MPHRERVKHQEHIHAAPPVHARTVAKLLSVSTMTVIRMEADGRLQPIKLSPGVSARTYYRSADIYALIGRRGGDDAA